MAVSFVAVGTGDAASNSSITPSLPTRIAGDLLVAVVSIRTIATGVVVNSGSGWTNRYTYVHGNAGGLSTITIWTRTATNDANDAVSFDNDASVTGCTNIGFIFSVRGHNTTTPIATDQRNGNDSGATVATNIGPTATLTANNTGGLAILVGHKSDDTNNTSTPVANVTNWTLIQGRTSASGNDATMGAFYRATTASTSYGGETITVNATTPTALWASAIIIIDPEPAGTTYDDALSLGLTAGISDSASLTASAGLTLNTGVGIADGSICSGTSQTVLASLQAIQTPAPTIDTSASLSLGAVLNLLTAGTPDAVEVSLALASLLGFSDSALLTRAGDVSLGASLDITDSSLISAVNALTLASSLGITDSGLADRAGAVALGSSLGLTDSSQISAGGAVTLAAALAINQLSQLDGGAALALPFTLSATFNGSLAGSTYEAALQLSSFMALQQAATLTSDQTLDLDVTVGVSTSAIIGAGATLTLPLQLALTDSAQLDAGAALTAAVTLAQTVATAAVLVGNLDLATAQALALTGERIIFASLAQQVALGLVAQSAKLNLNVDTPDCRLVTVTVELRVATVAPEVRLMTVEVEERSMTVEAENRTVTVEADERELAPIC
jgi:hypothetical protein